jgi:hypothetical protein
MLTSASGGWNVAIETGPVAARWGPVSIRQGRRQITVGGHSEYAERRHSPYEHSSAKRH